MGADVNIIVIEDHDSLREVTVSALQDMGHKVRGIACAESLNSELESGIPQILILDLNLPGEDGVSLASRLRHKHPGVGIIMVTARKEPADKIAGYENGADIYLTKPTSLDELAAAVQALSRRITIWAEDSLQSVLDPGQLKSAERARAVQQQLINTPGKLPTMDELAAQYGCSVRTLNNEFAAEYGQSMQSYIAEYRFNCAYAALQQTTIPMKILADQLGYSHVNHFISAFRKRFGYPPGALRKQERDEQ
jgi:DNA-binding response OmpR family regulator